MLAPWDHPVSGGELQRLSVARAVLADRPVLLLDEPTRHLDAATADTVLQAVLEARPTGRCCGSPTARKNWPRSRRFTTSARTP